MYVHAYMQQAVRTAVKLLMFSVCLLTGPQPNSVFSSFLSAVRPPTPDSFFCDGQTHFIAGWSTKQLPCKCTATTAKDCTRVSIGSGFTEPPLLKLKTDRDSPVANSCVSTAVEARKCLCPSRAVYTSVGIEHACHCRPPPPRSPYLLVGCWGLRWLRLEFICLTAAVTWHVIIIDSRSGGRAGEFRNPPAVSGAGVRPVVRSLALFAANVAVAVDVDAVATIYYCSLYVRRNENFCVREASYFLYLFLWLGVQT